MLLIDAYNVLHLPQAPATGDGLGIADLCRLFGESRYAGRRALLVCDGTPPPGSGVSPRASGAGRTRLAGVEILFTGPGSSADDEIEARLRAVGGAGVLVVSDDRRLKRAASRARARSLPSGTFLAHLLADRAARRRKAAPSFTRDIPLDAYSVAHWANEMGVPMPEPQGLTRRPPPGHAAPPRVAPHEGQKAGPPSERRDEPALPDERVLRIDALSRDPVIREAIEAWKGRLRVEDLDMEQWLRDRSRRAPDGGR